MADKERNLRRSRVMVILQAAFEYLISILVVDSFLASLTGELGISDSVTGILSAFVSLGCFFQLLSFPVHIRRTRSFVIGMSVADQLLFLSLYLIPLLPVPSQMKIPLFVGAIFAAYFIFNFAHPGKINWTMSLIDDRSRGRFTAVKEMVSLLMGMGFSYGMSAVLDHYRDAGNFRTGFAVAAAVIAVLGVLHTLSLVFMNEAEKAEAPKTNMREKFLRLFRNKPLVRVMGLIALWQIVSFISMPFYGTYQINELGFTLKTVSLLGIISALVRMAASFSLGAYADRAGFAKMIRICFAVMGLGFLCAALSRPGSGRMLFVGYYVCRGFAMGGINSSLINLIFDYAEPAQRENAVALTQAVSGICGFFATLAVTPMVSAIQKNGDRLFGLSLYAQQVLSLVSLLGTLLLILLLTRKLIGTEKTYGKDKEIQ